MYEAAFGSEIRKALPEAALLVNLSNDAWFGDSLGPHQGLEIVRMRAMETGRYVLRATNTGLTAVVSPDGKIQAQAPQFETYTLEATVTPRSGITPHSRFGDLSTVLVLSALLVVTWLPARRRK